MDSSLIQENVQDLHLIPLQPVIEEDQLDLKAIPIEDHSVYSDTLERLNYYKAAQKGLEYDNEPSFEEIQATILNVGYRKVGKASQPLKITLLKTGFSPTWRLLMAYINNSLGATKLNNSVRHPSPAYARFILLILEKALDVAGLDLCDNVYDGSPSEDPKLNEIIHNVKTKTMSSLLDPNSIATTDVYQYKVVTNVLNEDVTGESTIPSGSCDHNLKDDFHGKANEISDCLNEEVIDQSAIHSGTGDQSLKDDCLGKTIELSNCLNDEVVYQSEIPSGSGDHNLKDDCFGKINEVSNCLNQEVIVETIIPTCYDDHNLKVDCYVNSNEVSNIQNH
ncbi:hypothetical protein Tco_0173715 [Tanacetum coccineum]